MALNSQTNLFTLEYTDGYGQPKINSPIATGRENFDLSKTDGYGQPKIFPALSGPAPPPPPPAAAPAMYANIAGTWKQADNIYYKVNGNWRTISAISYKTGGTWRSI